ncbi:hypothetical protein [Nocardioides lianchengensis]|uniref:Uncharacterized protein n=1 Tax=Nocardioides lianchengensis TaxID=1045774 RepID=A0A1G6LS75_9ACTN|nr:hypothetical protein [Nocardioides lianchengensis]NYG12459.1 hypothetical protein [Nocardioides lianchengensis]SDC46148.1 hypothetical protein SAMN05421872_102345 [Nocardioides lianchengensis]
MSTATVRGADDLCVAVENLLREKLPVLVEVLGLEDRYKPVKEWQQLPTIEALASARFPAVAITSPGLTGPPTYSRASDAWTATWRIAVGIYDRGRDHDDTQARVRDWCSFIRTVCLVNRSLGGVATGVTWVGEEYRLVPQKDKARTFAGGAVALDVTASGLFDLGADVLPTVLSTHPSLSVRTHQE